MNLTTSCDSNGSENPIPQYTVGFIWVLLLDSLHFAAFGTIVVRA